jgi:Fic-DOC domain mobile mystery protein B
MTTTFEYPEDATLLDPDEIEGLKFKHVTTHAELDHLEQANIESGLQWLKRARNVNVLDERFLRNLHRKLFGEVWNWAGDFRTTEKNIGVDPIQIPIRLRALLDDVRFWLENETYPATEMALRFHHRLVKIHLFANGNGRHARIAADLLLTRWLNSAPIDWTAGQDLQALTSRRAEYIKALRAADAHDYVPLLAFGDAERSD